MEGQAVRRAPRFVTLSLNAVSRMSVEKGRTNCARERRKANPFAPLRDDKTGEPRGMTKAQNKKQIPFGNGKPEAPKGMESQEEIKGVEALSQIGT